MIHPSSSMMKVPQAVFNGAGRLLSHTKIFVPPLSNSAVTSMEADLSTTMYWEGSSILVMLNVTLRSA